jgi:hypothetical protein
LYKPSVILLIMTKTSFPRIIIHTPPHRYHKDHIHDQRRQPRKENHEKQAMNAKQKVTKPCQ